MSWSAVQREAQTPQRSHPTSDLSASSPPQPLGLPALPTERCQVADGAECPLAAPAQERSGFETFLADLSAPFLRDPADQVGSQLVAGLRRIVEFLGIDRSGFAELVAHQNQLVISHSYEVPSVPATPRIYVEDHWPDYASKVQEGEPFRVPEDLPPGRWLFSGSRDSPNYRPTQRR